MLSEKIRKIIKKHYVNIAIISLLGSIQSVCNQLVSSYLFSMMTACLLIGNFSLLNKGMAFWMMITVFNMIFYNILDLTVKYISKLFYPTLDTQLRLTLFDYIHQLSLDSILQIGEGSLENIMDSIVEGITECCQYLLEIIIPHILCIIVILIYIIRQQVMLGLFYVLWLLIYSTLILLLYKTSLTKSKQYNKIANKRTGIIVDMFRNIRTTMLLNIISTLSNRVANILGKEKVHYSNYLYSDYKNSFILFIVYVIIEVGIYVLLYIFLTVGYIGAQQALVILNTTYLMVNKMFSIIEHVVDINEHLGQMHQSFDQLNNIPFRKQKNAALKESINRFDIINLSYSIQHKKIINNLSLSVKKGDRLVIVGPSGSGKTTLIYLMIGLLSVTEGHIFINKKDINNLKTDSISDQISYVGQNRALYNSSILNNLCYVKPKANPQEIQTVLKQAEIISLSNRLSETVGSGGSKLSGGQCKRLCLARALLNHKKNNILILDELTGDLDSGSAHKLINMVFNSIEANIIIAIDHSGLLARHATKILFFHRNGNYSIDTHEVLLSTNSEYSSYFKHLCH